MEIPILTDTEPETSIEQDAKDVVCENITSNTKGSLFNITLDNLGCDEHESVEFRDYESRLQQEMKQWKSLLQTAWQELKKSKQPHPTVDVSVLPEEKRAYLANAPCLQSFLRESMDFRQEVYLFMETNYEEFVRMRQDLQDLCEHTLNIFKANKIAENLANAGTDAKNST